MRFEHDVFISYPHLSNRDDNSGYNGWVAKFHKDLELRLADLLGRDALIWRDSKMPVGAVFGNVIRDRLRKSKVLLCILSPAYLRSDWCLKELREFRRAAQEAGGLTAGEQSRVIAVVKTPTPSVLPDELNDSLNLKFFERADDGTPIEFSQTPGGDKYEEYSRGVYRIAWPISQIVEQLGDDEGQAAVRKTIYLAETTRDRADDRRGVAEELAARGFTVLPSEQLPRDTAQEYVEAVRANLARSSMSVHLVGRSYGLIPDEGDGKSVVHLQNELAARHSAEDANFSRLIWVPAELSNIEPAQAAFLEALRNSEEALAGAELLERPFEVMKTRLIQKLVKSEPPPPVPNLIRVYLMCDKEDSDSVRPVESYLFEKGFEVIPPPDEGEEGQVIQYHKNNLLLCDAALILYGRASRNWVRLCLDDVTVRARGWGRERDVPCRAILRTPPPNEKKDGFMTYMAHVLNPPCYAEPLEPPALEASLRDFIQCVEANSRRAEA